MPHYLYSAPLKWPLLTLALLVGASFFPQPGAPTRAACDPDARPFYGYTFLLPDIVNKDAAYAPFFLRWDDYYQQYYFNRDIQWAENTDEWSARFCAHATREEVDLVVYQAGTNDLVALRDRITNGKPNDPLPYPFEGNIFADLIVSSQCLEVVDYLLFAHSVEPYVTASADPWRQPNRSRQQMEELIKQGLERFRQTHSHFIKLRYAYQIIRLAHYSKQYQRTIDLFNELMPQIDRRKPSVIFYWTLGHVAGALQALGRYPEAAYRYSLIFRNCASKRTQAFRSFLLRNDADWKKALDFCQNDRERATLYILRAGRSGSYTAADLESIYAFDPGNPQLDLLLIANVQSLERRFLRTSVTDQKRKLSFTNAQRDAAALELLDLQKLVRRIAREARSANPLLWSAIEGYLELLAGDHYAVKKTFKLVEKQLERSEPYHQHLQTQIELWRLLLEIMEINPGDAFADQAAFRVRSYDLFKKNPNFEPFLQEWLSAAYAAGKQPGKALLMAYPAEALTYNPDPVVLDDLIRASEQDDPVFLEKSMMMDTNPEYLKAYLREIKAAYLLGLGQPEAAIYVLQPVPKVELAEMQKFSPFKEVLHERINRPITDTLRLNRLQIADKLMDFEFQARAKSALQDPDAARYFYLIGLFYYNTSYFGYEWEVADYFRSGASWTRLAQGPVFPLRNSPAGNRENTDVQLALSYFERALQTARDKELAARAAFMAARCRQKQYFCSPACSYPLGSRLIPVLPPEYRTYYDLLGREFRDTEFFGQAVKECRWLEKYLQ